MKEGEPKPMDKEDKKKAEELGGSDLEEYDAPVEIRYCDKKDHLERSKHNDNGQHNKHKQKEEVT